MSGVAVSTVQGAAYGFLSAAPIFSVEAGWRALTQRPFRGYWLWAWGKGELLTLRCGVDANILAAPASLESFDRGVEPEAFLGYVDAVANLHRLEGVPVHSDILGGFGHEPLPLPAVGAGVDLAFTYRGLVRGIVLVGIQIP